MRLTDSEVKVSILRREIVKQAPSNRGLFIEALEAFRQAEINAFDTFGDEGKEKLLLDPSEDNRERYADLLYRSICCTSPFDTNPDVRNMFLAAGYRY